jgi:serine/threonine-protein kinase
MGVVYSAEHTLIGRKAAIKVLLPEMSAHPEIVERFFNEARAASAVSHPGIVDIFDFGKDGDGSAYIVMELLEGESLHERIGRKRVLDPAEALDIAQQVAGALAAAHDAGIVHRDLKPDNIFLIPAPDMPSGERVKLLDFGIAKLSDSFGARKTRAGVVMGTPSYMAPEQCEGMVNADRRTDLYALGCMLYEMVCGRLPFDGEVAAVLVSHITGTPVAPRHINPALPVGVEALILRLMRKKPEERYDTAREVMAAIHGLRITPQARSSAAMPTMSAEHFQRLSSPQVTGAPGFAPAPGTMPPIAALPAMMSQSRPTTLSMAAGVTAASVPEPRTKTAWALPVALLAIVLAGGIAALAVVTSGSDASASSDSPAIDEPVTEPPIGAKPTPELVGNDEPKPEIDEPKPEADEPKPEADEPKPEADEPKPETDDEKRAADKKRKAEEKTAGVDRKDTIDQRVLKLSGAHNHRGVVRACKKARRAGKKMAVRTRSTCAVSACAIGDRSTAVKFTKSLSAAFQSSIKTKCAKHGIEIADLE